MTEIGFHRYEGYDLRTKFGWVDGAPGIGAVEAARTGLINVSGAFESSDMGIRDALGPLGLGWQGRAATAAGQALTRAATWAGGASAAQAGGGGSVGGYGESFEALRPKIHWEDPGMYGLWDRTVDLFGDVFDTQSDYQATAEANRALDAQANAALYAHEQTARDQLAAFPAVQPATPVATDTGPAAFGGGPAVGAPGGQAAGAAGGAAAVAPAGAVAGVAGPVAAAGSAAAATGGPTSGAAPAGPGAVTPAAGAVAGAAAVPDGARAAGGSGPTGRVPGAVPGARAAGGAGVTPLPAPRSAPPGGAVGLGARPGSPTAFGARPGSASGITGGGGPGARPSTGTDFARRLGIPVGPPGNAAGAFGRPAPPPLALGEPGARPVGPLEAATPRSAATPAATSTAAPAGRPAGMHGFAPMAAGLGAGGGDTEHTNRYRDPSSAAFEVDLPCTEPVIGGSS